MRYIHLKETKPIHKRYIVPLVREGVSLGLCPSCFSCKQKSLVVILKGFSAKMK
jgi:hypothetical protein